MWLVMRLARGLAVEPGAAGRALAAADVLTMATMAGADITGGPRRGLLAPGHAADLIAISLDRLASLYLDLRTGLIEAVFGRAKPADVEAVFVGGCLSIEAFRPAAVDRTIVEERLATFLAQSKGAGQLARESLVAQLVPYYRQLYADW
jgi:5-methylthioadenosine/S-adenosylhomocysteine deaminase